MAYADLNTIHNPSTGAAPPASWGDQVRDNFEALGPAAWSVYTPTLSQGVSSNIAKSTTHSRYVRDGRKISWQFRLDPTAAGTAGSAVTLTVPVTAVASGLGVGGGWYFDASVQMYIGLWYLASATTIVLIRDNSAAGAGATPSFAVASGDALSGTITYEAAS